MTNWLEMPKKIRLIRSSNKTMILMPLRERENMTSKQTKNPIKGLINIRKRTNGSKSKEITLMTKMKGRMTVKAIMMAGKVIRRKSQRMAKMMRTISASIWMPT